MTTPTLADSLRKEYGWFTKRVDASRAQQDPVGIAFADGVLDGLKIAAQHIGIDLEAGR